jgi:predicted DNA-binding transcriptional regulator YafY
MDERRFGRPVASDDFDALGAEARAAVRTVEECIRLEHVCAIEYTDEGGRSKTLSVRPAFIRTNRSGHVVLWEMPVGGREWRELRLDRMTGARDTGEPFTPGWR